MKALLAGPQDVTTTDGATDEVRRMWEALRRRLRRSRRALLRPALPPRVARDRPGAGTPLARARRAPVAVPARRRRRRRAPCRATATRPAAGGLRLDATHARAARRARGRITSEPALPCGYDEAYLTWLFDELARVAQRGTLWADGVPRGRLWAELVEANDTVLGWYVCHLREAGSVASSSSPRLRGRADAVFAQLSSRAQALGAAALYGRLEPMLVAPATNAPSSIRPSDGRLLVHARDPELATALRAGDALLTRLDGEWW